MSMYNKFLYKNNLIEEEFIMASINVVGEKATVFLSDNSERSKLAKFFEETGKSLKTPTTYQDDGHEDKMYKFLLNVEIRDSKLEEWSEQVKKDSGTCRVYRMPRLLAANLPLSENKISLNEAKEKFKGEGYKSTLRDFTDHGKLKNSL